MIVAYAPEQNGPTLATRAYSTFCSDADARGLGRRLVAAAPAGSIDFSRNDYLGLAHDHRLARAAARGAARFGTGATGSRLLSGNGAVHRMLERRIARTLGTEGALVFPSGYQLNVSVVAALLDRGVLKRDPSVFCDRAMHASLYTACALAGVRPIRFHHNDLAQLESLLTASDAHAPRFILTESIFSMDGDVADVEGLRALARRYDAFLYIDDAHAVGMTGTHGYGLGAGAAHDGGMVIGTFSKALGGIGAYLAGSQALCAYLVQRCGGFIYTTASAPPSAAAALTAWNILPQLDARRAHVRALADALRAGLSRLTLDYARSSTHIVPIILHDSARTVAVRDRLAARGITVSAIRPPTVAPRTARLRVILTATHSKTHIDELLNALEDSIS